MKNMQLSEEQIQLLNELAAVDMPIKSIAEALGVDTDEFIREAYTQGTEIYNLYKAAELLANAVFMKKLAANAKIGIPQSQALLRKIMGDTRCENIKAFNDANII